MKKHEFYIKRRQRVNIRQCGVGYLIDVGKDRFFVTKDELGQIILCGQIVLKNYEGKNTVC